ncbi:MAG: Copper binding protein plastocyanin/azurin family [Frankiaceae bacterium]|jgi:plastocyanin|nr:Copper binding protein plastocyanin/azurin family [Frankiaceae bacterium]
MGNVPRIATAAVLCVAAAGSAPVLAQGAAVHHRTVALQADNFRFCAASAAACLPTDSGNTTTVKVGTRVSWTYTDTACDVIVPCPGHNVIFAKGGSKKLVKSDGARIFSMVFRRAGTYDYFCSAHEPFGMTGAVVVKRR